MAQAVYMDYNAGAPVCSEAAAAMAEALAEAGNPSSVHGFGRAARRRLETARVQVADLVGADPERVVFTSGGTEANNLALRGSGAGRVLVSAGEHDSVLAAVQGAEHIPLEAGGRVDLERLAEMLRSAPAPKLVSVMLANNETGVIQPVAEVARLVTEAGAVMHCDAVQAAGKIPVDIDALGAGLMSLSAHKLGGPQGVGTLVLGRGVEVGALLRGGGQERGRRAGTENLPGVAGFGAAAGVAARSLGQAAALAEWRDELEAGIKSLAPEAVIYGAGVPRLANTSCITLPGVPAETQVMALDLAGIAVSAGSACSSGKVRPSHVLQAMGVPDEAAGCAIRVSLGRETRRADIDRFLDAWRALYDRCAETPRAASPAA